MSVSSPLLGGHEVCESSQSHGRTAKTLLLEVVCVLPNSHHLPPPPKSETALPHACLTFTVAADGANGWQPNESQKPLCSTSYA